MITGVVAIIIIILTRALPLGGQSREVSPLILDRTFPFPFAKICKPLSNLGPPGLPKRVPNLQSRFPNLRKGDTGPGVSVGRKKSQGTSSKSSPAKPEAHRAKETAGLQFPLRAQAVCVPRSAPTATPRCCGQGQRTSDAWWASATCGAMTFSWTARMTGKPTTMRCVTATQTTWRRVCASWAPVAASQRTPCTSAHRVPITGKVGTMGDGGGRSTHAQASPGDSSPDPPH